MMRNASSVLLTVSALVPALMGAKGCAFGGTVDFAGTGGGSGVVPVGGASSIAHGGSPPEGGASMVATGGNIPVGGATLVSSGGSPSAGGATSVSPCAPQDASAWIVLDSTMPTQILGFAWNGSECINLNGHGCSGEDCAELYASRAACEAACLTTVTPVNGTSLVMDSTGRVGADTNPWQIQGAWFAASDQWEGGQSRINLAEGEVPFVAGQGMCITGTLASGVDDNYRSWGALIGLNLNQQPGGGLALPLTTAPRCFTVVLGPVTGSAQLRADVIPDVQRDPWVAPPTKNLTEGANEVCKDNVAVAPYCNAATQTCLGPESLAGGIASLQIVAPSGVTATPISFCIKEIMAHD